MTEPDPNRSDRALGAGPRVALALAFASALAAFALQASIARTTGVIDDGGITLRYAERIATGQGFNYDPTAPTAGASNPLYTLLLAGLLALGVAPWTAVQGIGFSALAAAVGLLTHAFARRASAAAALFVAAALGTNVFVSSHLVNGLETPLTVLFAAGLVHACTTRSQVWAGVCLGLIVANKVDGGAAALAYAAAYALFERRFPWRAALVAAAVALPIYAVMFASFGTVIPGAAAAKIGVHESAAFDRTWVVDGLLHHARAARLPHLAAASIALLLVRRWRSMVAATVWIWLAIHVAAFSLIDLGDTYPWYLIAPVVLLVPLAGLLLQRALDLTLGWLPDRPRPWIALVLVAVASAAAFRGSVQRLVAPRLDGDELHAFTLTDLARQVAGSWLRANTSGTELFETAFGLPAYAYGGPVYDSTGLNNRLDPERGAAAAYAIAEVAGGKPDPFQFGRRLVAFFRLGPDSVGYALYAARESELRQRGTTYLPMGGATGPEPFDPAALEAVSPRARRHLGRLAAEFAADGFAPWARVD